MHSSTISPPPSIYATGVIFANMFLSTSGKLDQIGNLVWWFGLLGSPYDTVLRDTPKHCGKGIDTVLRDTPRIPNHGAPNRQLPLVDKNLFSKN